MAKDAFNKMKAIFTNRKLSLNVKLHLIKTFVWSILLYGAEAWILNAETHRNIEAAEMWLYRRMLKISCHVTNDEVPHLMQVERQLLKIIERRQLKFLGHYIRRGKLEDSCLGGKINGKRARGRQRKICLQNFTHSNQHENYGMPPETEMNVGSCIKLVHLSPNRVALKMKNKIDEYNAMFSHF